MIAPTPREQRLVARAVLARGRDYGLLVFSAADTHLHIASVCSHREAMELARRVEISITKGGAQVGFEVAKVDAVVQQWHLQNLGSYILRQDKRHDVEALDPLRECSNLPDLLGARLLGAYTRTYLRRALPRFHRQDFLRLFGLSQLEPADEPLELLPLAAAVAVC